jgi:hypothetical protein
MRLNTNREAAPDMPLWPWSKPKQKPEDAVRDLRELALTRAAADLGLSPGPESPNVFGILMETAYPEAVASLVVFAEGSTSLYFSNGGGIIGAGEHASVRATLGAFFAETEAHLSAFTPAESTPLPAPGRVRFYLRTFKGTLTAEADEQALGNMQHELSPVFHRGHAVISAVLEATDGMSPEPGAH